MSQAEIAGGTVSQQNEVPAKGRRLHDFELVEALGSTVRLSDYRSHANLVVIATDDRPETAKLLSDAASRYREIKNAEAEVLAVRHSSRDHAVAFKQSLNLPYPVLADPDGRLHRKLGAVDSQGRDSAAVYVTDRFGEVFGVYRAAVGQPLLASLTFWTGLSSSMHSAPNASRRNGQCERMQRGDDKAERLARIARVIAMRKPSLRDLRRVSDMLNQQLCNPDGYQQEVACLPG